MTKLENKSANKNQRLDSFQNELMHAVENADLDQVKELLQKGVDPSLPNSQGENAIHLAAASKDNPEIIPIIKELTDYGANLNHQDIEGNTPLHIGIKTVNLNGVCALLELEADTTMKNASCFSATPLDEAKLVLGNVHFLLTSARSQSERKSAEEMYAKAQTIYSLLENNEA